MFQRRLTWFWVLLTGLSVLIVARLAQVQLVQADEYRRLAARILTRRPTYITAPRGGIFDVHHQPLVSDEPSADVSVHYAVLAGRAEPLRQYLVGVARELRRAGEYPPEARLQDIADQLAAEIPVTWARLAEISGQTEEELAEKAARIRARIERWRARAEGPVREETQLLPLLENVDHRVALRVRLEFARCPWLRVVPSTRRVAHDVDALVHVLGRLGAASPESIAEDPHAGDELRALRPDDRCGISGVERLAESSLRGARGRIIYDYNWQELERVDAVAGRDVHLTIDRELQHFVFELLAEAVSARPEGQRSGAAAVVIDAATRDIRALVSYPAYKAEEFNERFAALERDARGRPLLFRAVQGQYPPGSICKTLTLIGALSEDVVKPDTRIHCTGHLLPESTERFRCWIYNRTPGLTHDALEPGGQDAASAVKNSCNIYFFRVGERLGPERLCDWFVRCGLGRPAGTGLIEESRGIVPTAEWLWARQHRRHQPSDAWNFAIGQGEVAITPLQAANVAATIATGQWAPVRLARDDAGHAFGAAPEAPVTIEERALEPLRVGMWRAVNEAGGTGRPARLADGDYVLCGKTGSAQAQPWPVAYRWTFELADGRRVESVAYLEQDARARVGAEDAPCVGRRTEERHPALAEGMRLPAHAWFIGFTQPARTPRGARPRGPVYALSVLVEFGESGGKVAGPIARRIAEYLLDQRADASERGDAADEFEMIVDD